MGKDKKPPRATLEQRLKIIDYYHKSQQSQMLTVDKFRDEVAISSSSFSQWLKNEEEYRQRCSSVDSAYQKQSRRKVTYKYDKINRAMDLLVQQLLERGEEVTEPVLRDHWQIYAHRFGVENPKRLCSFSHGWLGQFKRRHGLLRTKQEPQSPVLSNEKLLASAESPNGKLGEDEKYKRVSDSGSHERLPGLPERLSALPERLSGLPERLQNPELNSGNPGNSGLLNQVDDQSSEFPKQPQSLSEKEPKEGSAQFRPQESLSFPPFSYLSGPQRKSPQKSSQGTPPLASMSKASAQDIERFLADVADPFFRANPYDYPQTAKAYLDFKAAFLSERYIDLRSSKEPSASAERPPSLSPAISLESLQRQPRPLARRMLSANERVVSQMVSPPQPRSTSSHGQSHGQPSHVQTRSSHVQAGSSHVQTGSSQNEPLQYPFVSRVVSPSASHPVDFRSRNRHFRSASFSPQPAISYKTPVDKSDFGDAKFNGNHGERGLGQKRTPENFEGRDFDRTLEQRDFERGTALQKSFDREPEFPKPHFQKQVPEEGMDEIFVQNSYKNQYKPKEKSASQKLWEQNKIMLS